MALPFKKKKEESTNDKIIRLYQEGKTVEEICAEVESRSDIVTGVIQRKLGADAVPDAVVTQKTAPAPSVAEKAEAAAEIVAEAAAESAAADEADDMEGLSKLERYMREKKKKLESAAKEPETAPAEDNAMEGISLPEETESADDAADEIVPSPVSVEPMKVEPVEVEPVEVAPVEVAPVELADIDAPVQLADIDAADTADASDTEETASIALTDITETVETEEHKVSLVDEYMAKGSTETAADKSISLVEDKPEAAAQVPSYTIPSSGEEFAEMDAVIPPDIDTADLSDKPILSYDFGAEETEEEAAAEGTDTAPTDETAAADYADDTADQASTAADKMKAFAMSQIEANNAKIAELENENGALSSDYAAKIDDANTALTISQSTLDTLEAKLNEAYAAAEQAREEHRAAIAKADDEYRAKLDAIEEEYRNATAEANNKYQEVDDKNRLLIADLDNDKAAAQSDIVAKRAAVAELHTKLDAESGKLTAQIKALKDENAGYEGFLK